MKRTSSIAAAAFGLMTLTAGSYAFAAGRNPSQSSSVRTNGSDVTLMPGSGTDTLRLHFSGAEIITHEGPGGLMIVKAKGRLLHYRPNAYQVIDGEMRPVEVGFRIDGVDQVVVQFGKIDKNAPVILKQGTVMYDKPVLM
jgi:hypothetical protein